MESLENATGNVTVVNSHTWYRPLAGGWARPVGVIVSLLNRRVCESFRRSWD